MTINSGMSAYGAVDLSALARPKAAPSAAGAQGAAGAGAGAGMAGAADQGGASVPGPYVLEATKDNLQTVVNNSLQLPVFVVFHSSHSPNSATLLEMLTRLVNQYRGRFQLVTVNTDTEREVTGAFGVTAVPAAVAILQGQPVPLFQGLPDEPSVTDGIEKVLQAAAQYGLTGVLTGEGDGEAEANAEPPLPPLVQEAQDAIEAGDLAGAHAAYEKAIKENPGDNDAKIAMHYVELLQRVEALGVDRDPVAAQAVLVQAEQAGVEAVDEQLNAADVEAAFGQMAQALERVLAVIRATEGAERDRARLRLLDLFDVAGQQSELVKAARKALTNALF